MHLKLPKKSKPSLEDWIKNIVGTIVAIGTKKE